MGDFHFEEVIIAAAGRRRVVNSVAQAAEHLSEGWPIDHGPKLFAARQACIGAMEGKLAAQEARLAFVDAATEAGILLGSQCRRRMRGGKPVNIWRKRRARNA